LKERARVGRRPAVDLWVGDAADDVLDHVRVAQTVQLRRRATDDRHRQCDRARDVLSDQAVHVRQAGDVHVDRRRIPQLEVGEQAQLGELWNPTGRIVAGRDPTEARCGPRRSRERPRRPAAGAIDVVEDQVAVVVDVESADDAVPVEIGALALIPQGLPGAHAPELAGPDGPAGDRPGGRERLGRIAPGGHFRHQRIALFQNHLPHVQAGRSLHGLVCLGPARLQHDRPEVRTVGAHEMQ
jgi:hypothetical protein